MAEVPENSLQEGIDFNLDTKLNPELQKFLDDKILTSDEAKALTKIFNANVWEILDYSRDNLILLKETIKNTTWIDVWDSSLIRDSIEKQIIADIGNQWSSDLLENSWETDDELWFEEEDFHDQYIQSVREQEHEFDEYDVDFEEMSDEDFDAYLNIFWNKLQQLWIDGSQDVMKQVESDSWLFTQVQLVAAEFLSEDKRDVFAIDGEPWPQSDYAIRNMIESVDWIDSIEDILTQYTFEVFEYDTAFVWGKDLMPIRERFNEKYWLFLAKIESDLWLPSWISAAIVRKESRFGTELNSSTWSKWMSQLTIWPFKDMRWQWTENLTQRNTKIKRYQKIFASIDFDWLKRSAPEWALPNFIWERLIELQTSTPDRAEQILSELQDIIKSWSNKENYLHVLNMIIGDVYFKDLYNGTSETATTEDRIKSAARNYNWDITVITARTGNKVQVRDSYKLTIAKYWREEQEFIGGNSNKEISAS